MTTLTPVNYEAERAVLIAAFIWPEDFMLNLVEKGLIDSSAFHLVRHEYIYEAMLNLVEKGVPTDAPAVIDELKSAGRYDGAGGVGYIYELASQFATHGMGEYYAGILMRLARRRRLIELGGQVSALAWKEDADPDQTIEDAERMLKLERDASPRRKRLGKSAKRLMSLEFPERVWVISELLPEGLSILAGPPKTGKSFAVLGWALAAASGGKALGHLAATPSDVLYLVLEDGERRLQERLRLMGETATTIPHRFEYDDEAKRVDGGLLEQLRHWLEDRSGNGLGKFIIIDTLAMVKPARNVFRNVYDEDYGGVVELRKLAQQHRVAVLLVHHTRKLDAKDVFDLVSGSYGLTGAVESEMVMRKRDGVMQLSAKGKEIGEKTYELRFDDGIKQWMLVGEVGQSGAGLPPLRRQVLELLSGNQCLTPREIAEMLDRPYNNVVQHLKGMRDDGLVESDNGFYRVLDDHI